MRKLQATLIAILLLLTLSSPAINAQAVGPNAPQRERYGIERYLNIRGSGSPTLSPNADRIAFLTNITGTPQVWMVSAQGGWPEQMTFYTDSVGFVRWSPDGSGLVFGKARGGDENSQLFWLSADGSEIKALTNDPKIRHNFGSWSHDGKKISYASNKRNKDYFDIYIMDVASGREELVYQQDGSNSAVAWSFDDRWLVVSHANEQLSQDNDLYLVSLDSKQATHLTPHEGAAQFGDVNFTRDGKYILFSTNDKREFSSLARMNLSNKSVEILDDTQWDLASTTISDDGRMFAYTINRDGFSELYVTEISADGKPAAKPEIVKLPSKGLIGSLNFSKDNSKLVFTFNSARYNSDVWLYDLKSRALSQVTRSSRAGIPQSSFVEPELIRFKTFDGREVPAWYYRPQTVAAGGKLPVLVSVHGGPEGQETPGFSSIYQYFLSRGYAVLAPNVRGSTGYGKTYAHLDDVRKREDSVKDLAAAVEWLKTSGGADARRIAVMGGSYGGYMTLAAITLYPELWAAAVDTVGIANFESFLK
ncbi:MAG: S9 family peptidase, partial [Pyrinomonadaceae bacterium]|nr:S9 family peptidase [Pyrinomonadaceae bacterium]